MEIKKSLNGTSLAVTVVGRLDTLTAPQLQGDLEGSMAGVTDLTIDFSALDYISSAGLRVLLSLHKKMLGSGGEMRVKGSNAVVKEVFEMTGFSDILTLV